MKALTGPTTALTAASAAANWGREALVPPETPSMVRKLLERLKLGG